ncbi:MAG: YlmH/Sll1252 family protein [Clostridiales bacterium]|nr:YlmH/Sll1252 family protein [Clostridiales bacterium]
MKFVVRYLLSKEKAMNGPDKYGEMDMQEEQELRRHILDLANRCYQSNVYTYSAFLGMGDQAVFHAMEHEVSFVPWMLFGGSGNCERRILRFGSPEMLGYEEDFPIRCLIVRPRIQKFADALTHRDFLGALMNLGVERDVLGDIVVRDQAAYVFCEDTMAEYLQEHLDRVKHTGVICEITDECPDAAQPEFSAQELVVSSERCDAVVAKVYQLSRSRSIQLFQSKRIFVNGRQFENNSGSLKPGDMVSVRGFGRFIFDGWLSETKKGRIRVRIRKYI